MALLNYTTKIPAVKTVAEIQGILAVHGAREILIEYGEGGSVEALSFMIETPSGKLPIRLPVNPDPILKVLQRQKSMGKLRSSIPIDHAQAVRIAWRIIKDWVEAQMAILETEMVRMEQIFLPYIVTDSGKTLYEGIAEKHFQLGPGEDQQGD